MGRSSTLASTPPQVIGDVIREIFSPRYNYETKNIQTGENLSLGDVCQESSSNEMLQISAAADEVQTITVGGTSAGGSLKIGFTLTDGSTVWSDTIAWSATEATMTASAQTALDNLLGTNAVVVSTIADTASLVMVLTFSGTGQTSLVRAPVHVDTSALTGASTVTVAETTAGKISGGNASAICLEDPSATADEVQTVTFTTQATAGTYTLSFMSEATGAIVTTDPINYDDSLATINTAIDAATGTTSDIIATGVTPDSGASNALVFTFSGGEYAGKSWRKIVADISLLTSATKVATVRTTTGGGGEALFLMRGPAVVDKDELGYNSQNEANADAALKALNIIPISELTVTTQTA